MGGLPHRFVIKLPIEKIYRLRNLNHVSKSDSVARLVGLLALAHLLLDRLPKGGVELGVESHQPADTNCRDLFTFTVLVGALLLRT